MQVLSIEIVMNLFPKKLSKKGKIAPRPPEIMKKGGAHTDKKKYNRRKKHANKEEGAS